MQSREGMKNLFHKIVLLAEKKVQENGEQYTAFGLFVVVTYPMYYFFWIYFSVQPYSNLILRIIAATLCLILALNKFWPVKTKKYLPLYWYVTLLYCLPFFFTYMVIENLFSPIWLANSILAFYWLMLFVDFRSFVFIFFLGAALGILLTSLFPPANLANANIDYFGIIVTYLVSLVIGGMFAHNREKIEHAKLQAIKDISATVAHELRTPLSTIQTATRRIKYYIAEIYSAKTLEKNLEGIQDAATDIEDETKYSNTIINMTLVYSTHNKIPTTDFKIYSMQKCIEEAIARYPFQTEEKNLVHYNNSCDFQFYGDKVLMTHVLFNLFKNALYFIAAAHKGTIEIWCESHKRNNMLYFKDTGMGIRQQDISRLFDKFYSTTRHGSGLGLAFCKRAMRSFGGNISCQSEFGEFTLFKLKFPKN